MTWVLWDILVPLLLAFGLGAILTWQVWRVFPHLFSARADTHSKDTPAQVEVESNVLVSDITHEDSASHGSDNKISHSDSEPNGALSKLEAANITLIEERDRATLALEEQTSEVAQLKSCNAELEGLLEERNTSSAEPELDVIAENAAADDLISNDPVDSKAKDLPEALRLGDINDNSDIIKAEVALLKENVESLTRSLDSERREKRELELQLLNANNRFKKLEGKFNVVPKSENITANSEFINKDSDPDSTNKPDGEQKAVTETQVNVNTVTEVAPELTADVVTKESEDKSQSKELPVVSIADEFFIEPSPVQTTSSKTDTPKKPSKQVDAPEGWAIPVVKPGKKERDQLTRIKGVGPVLEKLLHQSGIYFYQQVASLDKNGIDELQAKIPQFPGRIERDNWVDQAKKLHEDKYGAAV